MRTRVIAFLIWALAAASAVFWGLKALGGGPSAPLGAVTAPAFAPTQVDWQRLLGSAAPAAGSGLSAPATDAPLQGKRFDASRLRLIGVVAGGERRGDPSALALIAMDGKPARTFRTGAAIDDDHVIQRIESRRVSIGRRGGEVLSTLELPPGPPPSSGTVAAGPPLPSPTATPTIATSNRSTPGTNAPAQTDDTGASSEAPTDPRPPRRIEPPTLRAPDRINR